MAAMMSQSAGPHVHQVTGGMTLAQRDIQAATTSRKEMNKKSPEDSEDGIYMDL